MVDLILQDVDGWIEVMAKGKCVRLDITLIFFRTICTPARLTSGLEVT